MSPWNFSSLGYTASAPPTLHSFSSVALCIPFPIIFPPHSYSVLIFNRIWLILCICSLFNFLPSNPGLHLLQINALMLYSLPPTHSWFMCLLSDKAVISQVGCTLSPRIGDVFARNHSTSFKNLKTIEFKTVAVIWISLSFTLKVTFSSYP